MNQVSVFTHYKDMHYMEILIKEGELFIDHPTLKIGIDPSYANFHFSEHGTYNGWIDPLFHLEEHTPRR